MNDAPQRFGRGDRWWMWATRVAGLCLAVWDQAAGGITHYEAVAFYALLIFGPEAIKKDIRRNEAAERQPPAQ